MNGRALQWVIAGLRRTWLVAAATLFVCSVFAVHTVEALTTPQPQPPIYYPRLVPDLKIERPVKANDGSALVVRNMFCSTCAPSSAPGSTVLYKPDAILIATSIGKDSRATLRVPASEVQGSFGVGDVVPGVGHIERIGFVSVDVVGPEGQRGTISLFDGARSSDAGAATPAPASATPDPFADRIKKIDDHTFEVERSLVRDLVGGAVGTGGARISPKVTADGKLAGLRLFGVRPGQLASALGLQNGDVLEAINNQKIESANTLLEVYARLPTLSVVELAGTRAGKPLTLTLRLR